MGIFSFEPFHFVKLERFLIHTDETNTLFDVGKLYTHGYRS